MVCICPAADAVIKNCLLQEVPPHSWLKRNIGPPLNRYSIRPGKTFLEIVLGVSGILLLLKWNHLCKHSEVSFLHLRRAALGWGGPLEWL